MGDLFAIGLMVLLLLGNGFFVGAEFALISARRDRLEALDEQGHKRAQTVIRAGEQLSRMLAGAQLGITICSILLGRVAEPAIAHLIETPLEAVGVPGVLLHPIAFTIALAIVVVLHILVGEMVPKNIAIAGPERTAMLLVPAHVFATRLMSPLITLYNFLANKTLRLFGVEPRDELDSAVSVRELADMIRESRSEGLLDEDEHRRLTRTLRTAGRTVADVLIPVSRVRGLPLQHGGTTLGAIEKAVADTGFSRYPIADEAGEYVGYLHLKDALDAVIDESAGPATVIPRELIRPLPSIPGNTPLDEALAALRLDSSHLGKVVTSTGRTVGIVALEDLLEEFVGRVRDSTHRR
ncbi:hemolysin family protein [Hoyosella altamirensis]|uniref:CBS domain containing-hemolysin-like protein n=1 Tax=Hoyosella altamirensis TaxID=616997 RepID=A0A839RJK5_9ACTN|nr:hemolysin family protein [Hoyosella altamirensis]MBB3036306.1 CBS domain containing-hemolysin-like protein [Hoyosella altamirensis]